MNLNPKIPYTKPSITELEIKFVYDAVANGWGEHCYDYIEKFENLFKNYLGVKYAIATSSCTGALHMGLKALGIGPGDEVILADTNWIATCAPIVHLVAKPVFVDILPDSWCIDPDQVEKAISTKTKAIIVTHLYGNLCEMDRLLEISRKFGIPIIEDAAEAIGSVYHGKKAGSMGLFGVFSFHGTKTITTGEGGIFVTNDEKLYETVLTLSNHGRRRGEPRQFWPCMVGFKYKMSNLQAALGYAQLKRVDELVEKKREIFKYYAERILKIEGCYMNPEPEGCINSYWMPTVVFDSKLGIQREQILEAFRIENIDARVFFWPLSSLPMFEKVENKWAYEISKRAINLPSYHDMTIDEQERVIKVIRQISSKKEI